MDLFAYAQQRRDKGMDRAAGAQDRDDPNWGERAYEILEDLAYRREFIHVDDFLPIVAPPAHPNAFGAVWMRAKRNGLLEHSGRVRPSSDPRKNAHQYPIYRSLVWRPA